MVFSKMFTGLLECIKGARTEKRDAARRTQDYNEGRDAVMVVSSSNSKCFWQHTHCGNYVSATDSGDLVIRSLQQGDKSYRFNVTKTSGHDLRRTEEDAVILFSFWNHVNPKERDYIIYDLPNNDVRVKQCEAIEEDMEEVKTDDSRFFVHTYHRANITGSVFEVLQCPGLYLACRDSTLFLKRVDSQDLKYDQEIHFNIQYP